MYRKVQIVVTTSQHQWHGCSPVRLENLHGWSPHMEYADLLHVLWAGVARDVTGSLLLEVCEHSYTSGSWDERLQTLHSSCTHWCSKNHIRPSTIEQFSTENAYIVWTVHFFCSFFATACLTVVGFMRSEIVLFSTVVISDRPSRFAETFRGCDCV